MHLNGGGLCLDIANPEGRGPQSGASVIAYQCHGGPNQLFRVMNDGTIRAPQWGGLCLDIANPEGRGPQSGAPVIAYQCHGGPNQLFRVMNDGTIRAPQWGGLCLDIANPEGRGPQSGASVIAYQCHGGPNQRWQLGAADTGRGTFLPPETSPQVKAEKYLNMGGGWGGATATLNRDGYLVIEGRAVSDSATTATRTSVFVVGLDRRGRTLFVSKKYDIKTACGRWDPTCPSERVDTFTERIEPELARYVAQLNVYVGEHGSTGFQASLERIKENIRATCSSYEDLPVAARAAIARLTGVPGCNPGR